MRGVVSILVGYGDRTRVELVNGVDHCPLELCLVLHKVFCELQVENISVSVWNCCW